MRKYTERLDIKMTREDMNLLAAESLKAGYPITVYARMLILRQLNPLLGEQNEKLRMESNKTN